VEEESYTVQEAASILRTTERTVRRPNAEQDEECFEEPVVVLFRR
jgi:hypothetical protein